jgi:hypothetical protein
MQAFNVHPNVNEYPNIPVFFSVDDKYLRGLTW